MRPAFASTKSAAAFALLLLVLLALPVVLGQSWLPPREEAYSRQGWGSGPYPWIENQIFQETNAIDIAFLGSSHILNGIDTPYVQEQLSKKLGRPAVVRTIAWGGSGFDGLYLVTQDLLQHRKVKLLVFYDEKVELGEKLRNGALTSLFRLREQVSVLAGLPFKDQAAYYVVALMGIPRNLLSLVRLNFPAELLSNRPGYIEPENSGFIDAPSCLGAVNGRNGFSPSFFRPDHAPFVSYAPSVSNGTETIIYSPREGAFEFSHAPLPAWHVKFVRCFAALAKAQDCRLVMLSIPLYDERRASVITERAFWPDLLSADVTMLGILPAKMFGDLTDVDVQKLHDDPQHFNQNGQRYFTRLITPSLINLYETSTNH